MRSSVLTSAKRSIWLKWNLCWIRIRSININSYFKIHLQFNRYRHLEVCYVIGLTYKYTSLLCQRSGPKSSDTLVAISTPGRQSLVFKHHSLIKGTRTTWRSDWLQGWSRDNTGWAWNILWCQKRKMLKIKWKFVETPCKPLSRSY